MVPPGLISSGPPQISYGALYQANYKPKKFSPAALVATALIRYLREEWVDPSSLFVSMHISPFNDEPVLQAWCTPPPIGSLLEVKFDGELVHVLVTHYGNQVLNFKPVFVCSIPSIQVVHSQPTST